MKRMTQTTPPLSSRHMAREHSCPIDYTLVSSDCHAPETSAGDEVDA